MIAPRMSQGRFVLADLEVRALCVCRMLGACEPHPLHWEGQSFRCRTEPSHSCEEPRAGNLLYEIKSSKQFESIFCTFYLIGIHQNRFIFCSLPPFLKENAVPVNTRLVQQLGYRFYHWRRTTDVPQSILRYMFFQILLWHMATAWLWDGVGSDVEIADHVSGLCTSAPALGEAEVCMPGSPGVMWAQSDVRDVVLLQNNKF